MQAYRALFTKYNVGNRPLWDTEHSWGEPSAPMGGDEDSQAAWLARFQVLSVNNKIDRSIRYGWEYDGWGTLWSKSTKQRTKPGIAYGLVYNWLVNTTVDPCQVIGAIYQCRIHRADGTLALVAWAADGKAAFTVPAGFGRYDTLDAATIGSAAGTSVTLAMKPILFKP